MFRLNNRTKDGYTASCKECLNAKQNLVKWQNRIRRGIKKVDSLPNEEWRKIPGIVGYEVSSLARVKKVSTEISMRGGKIMSDEFILNQQTTYQGYLTVNINGFPRFVHRLVALAFIPNPNNLPIVNHIDENKANPLPHNLEWCDIRYNNLYGTGLLRRAVSRGTAVLQYSIDGDFIAEYYSMGAAATAIGVKSAGDICMCCKGQRPFAYGYVWKYKKQYDI